MNNFRIEAVAAICLLAFYFPLHPSLAADTATRNLQSTVNALVNKDKFSEATSLLNKELAAAGSNTTKLLSVYVAYIKVALAAKDKTSALKYIQLASKQNTKAHDKDAEAIIADLIGDYYCNLMDDCKSGLPYREKALSLIRQIYPASDPQIGPYEESLAKALNATGQASQAKLLEQARKSRDTTFMEVTQRRIKSSWHPGTMRYSKKVKVFFHIGEDGRASDARIINSSGFADFDAYCLTVINRVHMNPVKCWDFDPEPVAVEFTFDYNVFEGGRPVSTSGPETGTANGDSKISSSTTIVQSNLTNSTAEKTINDNIQKQLSLHYALQNEQKSLESNTSPISNKQLQQHFEVFDALLSMNKLDMAKNLLENMGARKNNTPKVLVLIKAESALILKQEKDFPEAEAALKESVESPEFEQLPGKEIRSKILKAYGDVLYMQHKSDEANKIYQRITQIK